MVECTVAAIIPNYNYADFIVERIDSILRQTYPISELIILDDASPDNSVKIIKEKLTEIRQKFPDLKIKLIVNEKNSGGCVFSQWQKGIKEAKSDYLWIAEADDSADEHFLETAMQKFEEYPSAVLFYSDSCRINKNGEVISETCMDWADMWGMGRWKEDFFNKGDDENINYLGETNPILNVSSVVWRNKSNLSKIFDEAKEFKVAGDWYIYTRVLEGGDVVYSAKPLNKYRKHDQGSASTVVKLSTEYSEVVKVQDRVAQKYKLSPENLEWQKVRRRGMGMVENEKNINKKGRIAWFAPDIIEGSGGHRTIFQNANELIRRGYACDLYIKPIWRPMLPREIYDNIKKWYGNFDGDVFNDYCLLRDYDMVIATGWETAKPAAETNIKRKLYFVQDFEPYFFPVSPEYLEAKRTYGYDLFPVTIGRWLSEKIKNDYNKDAGFFDLCADLTKYHRKKEAKKENAICFCCQPDKPRRCVSIGLKALQIVQKMRPDVKIYLFGSQKLRTYNVETEHLGLLSIDECNDLYNRCKVGLCLSTTNPSRVPFEMMATGLPVVDLKMENNLYDFPEEGCLLAEPSPEAIARAILEILEDEKLAKKLSDGGVKFMKERPISKGFEQFGEIVDTFFENKKYKTTKNKKIYKRAAVKELENIGELPPEPRYKALAQIEAEKKVEEELEARRRDEEWRRNLTIPQRIYLKIRYLLTGR